MSRHFDHEQMEHIRERVERIRAHVPSEEFDPTTALVIARTEIAPLYGMGPVPGVSSTNGGEMGGRDGE